MLFTEIQVRLPVPFIRQQRRQVKPSAKSLHRQTLMVRLLNARNGALLPPIIGGEQNNHEDMWVL